jgi:hypothetical protein
MDVRTLARSNFRSRCGRRPRNAGRVIEHGARRAQPAVDRELALQDEPDLGEAVIVIGMMGARREPQDAGIGRGRLLGAGMEQHLAGLARPADGLPVDLVEMAHLAGQMIRARARWRAGHWRADNFYLRASRRTPTTSAALSFGSFCNKFGIARFVRDLLFYENRIWQLYYLCD